MALWIAARDFFYPRVCASCEGLTRHPFPLCTECSSSLNRLKRPFCDRCGLPLPGSVAVEALCGECLRRPPAFDRARAAFIYKQADRTSALARAVARFKYGRKVTLSGALGELLRYGCPVDPFTYDWVTPVPLTLERLRWRGFNQALMLARNLFRSNNIIPTLLERTGESRPQADLGRDARLKNVRGAFRVREACRASVRGSAILLIDDVMTTGATVNECSLALKRAGARLVDVLVLARVPLT